MSFGMAPVSEPNCAAPPSLEPVLGSPRECARSPGSVGLGGPADNEMICLHVSLVCMDYLLFCNTQQRLIICGVQALT